MFKIGEFSKLVRVSPRMLRYYEKNGLLTPAEIDPFTGYRLYSASQITILHQIVRLRDMGFGVEEIGSLLSHYNDPIIMRKALTQKREEIRHNIAGEQSKLEMIAAMSDRFDKEREDMNEKVELKELLAQKVISLRGIIPSYDKERVLWEKLGKFMAEHHVDCESGGYSIYHDDDHKESDVDVEIAVPVKELGISQGEFVYRELEAVPVAATVRFTGPYDGYDAAIEKLAGWIEENGYAFAGPIRGQAIATPAEVSSPEDYITELQIPVIKV